VTTVLQEVANDSLQLTETCQSAGEIAGIFLIVIVYRQYNVWRTILSYLDISYGYLHIVTAIIII